MARDGVGLMVCIAVEGFHSLARYQWYKDDVPLQIETFPILYVQQGGEYSCIITISGVERRTSFRATGTIAELKVVYGECTKPAGLVVMNDVLTV